MNPEKTAKVLAGYIDLTEQEIVNLLNKNIKADKYQVEFGNAGRDISHADMIAIKQ